MKALLTSAALLLTVTAAQAAGSNIALSEYPGPACVKSVPPAEPQTPESRRGDNAATRAQNESRAAESYNVQVARYNKAIIAHNEAVKLFDACMRTYVENGNADMTRIKDRLNAAIAEANAR